MNGDPDSPGDEEAPLQWRIVQRHYFMQNNAKAKCAAFHAESNILVAGFSNGLFGLYELPEFNMIHTLRYTFQLFNSISSRSLTIRIQHISE